MKEKSMRSPSLEQNIKSIIFRRGKSYIFILSKITFYLCLLITYSVSSKSNFPNVDNVNIYIHFVFTQNTSIYPLHCSNTIVKRKYLMQFKTFRQTFNRYNRVKTIWNLKRNFLPNTSTPSTPFHTIKHSYTQDQSVDNVYKIMQIERDSDWD